MTLEAYVTSIENDFVVNGILYFTLLSFMQNKFELKTVAKNAVEYNAQLGTIRIEKNKKGFSVYAVSESLGSFSYKPIDTTLCESLYIQKAQ